LLAAVKAAADYDPTTFHFDFRVYVLYRTKMAIHAFGQRQRRRRPLASSHRPWALEAGDREPSPEHGAEYAELARAVRKALRQLTRRQRAVVRMHFWQGMRESEIAERLGLSRQRINEALRRALRVLGQHLGGVA
jgi:RNA polymerase sigma factor (sigma-70 family)